MTKAEAKQVVKGAQVKRRGDRWGEQTLWTVDLPDGSVDVYADDEDGAREAAAAYLVREA